MKKLFSLLFILFVSFSISSCALFGDGEPETKTYVVTFETNGGSVIESVNVKEGEVVERPANPTRDNCVFKGWYTTNSFEKEFDFNTKITENTTIYAKWEGNTAVRVLSVSKPEFISIFETTKQGSAVKQSEFFVLNNDYMVGDDNPFVCKPSVGFVNYNLVTKEMTPATIDTWQYIIKVTEKGSETVLEVGSEYVDAIDKENCSVDFGSAAVGKEMTITIIPEGLTDYQLLSENVVNYTVEFDVTVVDAYNVYNALDLAVVEDQSRNNVEVNDMDAAWTAFKQEKGLYTGRVNGVVLHSDINVTVDDIPSDFLLDERWVSEMDSDYEEAMGSFSDYESIYYRSLAENEVFNLYGNYFAIDTSSIPLVVREGGARNIHEKEKAVISHAQLFRFDDYLVEDKLSKSNCTINFSDVRLVGNSPKAENFNGAGGLIAYKASGPECHFENTISVRYFITYLFEYFGNNKQFIDKCKAYDAFNAFIYNWGADLTVTNSEFVGCGGPVLIQDHVNKGKDAEHISNTSFTDCVCDSYVAGTEMWFATVGATALVPSIKQMDAIFNAFGRSFLFTDKNDSTRDFFNFVAVNKSSELQTFTQIKVDGEIKLGEYAFNYGATNPYYKGVLDQTFTLGAPTFETSGGGFGYFDGQNLRDMTGAIIDGSNPNAYGFTQGDYLTIYFMGMALVFHYTSAGSVH